MVKKRYKRWFGLVTVEKHKEKLNEKIEGQVDSLQPSFFLKCRLIKIYIHFFTIAESSKKYTFG